ncbi:DNA-binding response OmpR family regulator [Rhizobium sp. BK313]|uniref:response regulator n=1 Tax=Rhizobium sp. BK313 TaxID=2587081 RepID=UPI00105E6E84|nr:response regulator [Rhizobium sp. BK313]MBB3458083.1 DNA-binding response OmpR family regulator [Rhizobium sp. BK313]
MKHVAIVDDDSTIRAILVELLSHHAFKVSAVADSQHLNRILASDPVDLVLVDLNLRHEDGLDIVRKLTARDDIAVIIVSGDRLEEADKVVGLELGAVDYITKPFGMRELIARIKAALRIRNFRPVALDKRTYHFAGWTLNIRRRRLTSSTGLEVKLTSAEFNLLVALVKAPHQILSRDQLIAATRMHNEEVFDRSVDVLILRLRRKLEDDPSKPKLVKTERGVGYFFGVNVDVAYA